MNRVKFSWLLIPAAINIAAVGRGQAQSRPADVASLAQAGTAAPTLKFDVASIRPTDPSKNWWRMQFTVDGFVADRMTLHQMIQEAYGAYEDGRVVGGPSWVDTEHFDVLARLDPAEVPMFKDLTLAQRREMLRALLEERFQLQVHAEQRSFPAFALRIAKGGVKLKRSSGVDLPANRVKGYDSLITRGRPGLLEGKNFSMHDLADVLEEPAQRLVVDETGLQGRYDFLPQWTPLDASGNPVETSRGNGDSSGESYPFFSRQSSRSSG